jgi:hypothetical protein
VLLHDLLDDRTELAAEVGVSRDVDVARERVDEPQRPVDRVVLE